MALTSIDTSRFSLCQRGRGGSLKEREVWARGPLERRLAALKLGALRIYRACRAVLCPWACKCHMWSRCSNAYLGGFVDRRPWSHVRRRHGRRSPKSDRNAIARASFGNRAARPGIVQRRSSAMRCHTRWVQWGRRETKCIKKSNERDWPKLCKRRF